MLRRTVASLLAILFLVIVARVFYPERKPELTEERFDCGGANPVIINGKQVGCTGDPQSPANVWIPSSGPAPLVRCRWCEGDDNNGGETAP